MLHVRTSNVGYFVKETQQAAIQLLYTIFLLHLLFDKLENSLKRKTKGLHLKQRLLPNVWMDAAKSFEKIKYMIWYKKSTWNQNA